MEAKIFERRRRGVMQLMGEGIAILPTNTHHPRNGDAFYPFRPDSDFYYLTEFPEPDAMAVLIPNRAEGEYILFCRESDEVRERWEGRRAGLGGAKAHFGADEAYPIDQMDRILPTLLENRDKVFHFPGRYPEFDRSLFEWINDIKTKVRGGVHAPSDFVDLSHILHELRLVKRADELRVMRRAAKLSAKGHVRAMQRCKPGLFEYEVQAELEYEFYRGGAKSPAYTSIVASGANACVLHYTENDSKCKDGDLLLIDAGAEIDCYAADITRTFPVNGKFTSEQRAVYELVLAAQTAAIEVLKPDADWMTYHDAAVEVLTRGMIELGLLKCGYDEAIEQKHYQRFYMHRTGHWLGMDVHDVGDYKVDDAWRVLEPGMVLTVEPGLYINPSKDIDQRWHNIGVRIEDDVVITKKGNDIISRDVPVDPDEIEAIMRDG